MFAKPSQLVTIISISYPSSLGSEPMKSMLMPLKQLLGTGRKYNSSTSLNVMVLFHIQSVQEEIYKLFRFWHT